MTLSSFPQRLLVALLLVSGVMLPNALAQESGAESSVQITAGDVFEILGVSLASDAQFDWVLTQNGTFVEAGRNKIYHTRLTQEGTYTLDGHTNGSDGEHRIHLQITVNPRSDSPDNQAPLGLDIVTTDLPSGQGGVRLPAKSPLLTLTPSPVLTGTISMDLNTRVDSDGDGDPANDNDGADTLFATEHNPLRLWFASSDVNAPMHFSTTAEDGTPLAQDIEVNESSAVPTGTINVGDERDGTVSFSISVGSRIDPRFVVTEWNFGDGQQSMVDETSHRFAANGEYEVYAIVRDMATGRVLAEGNETVTIAGVPEVAGSTSSASLSSSSAQSSIPVLPTPSSGASSFIWTLLKILFVLIVAGILGAIGVQGYYKLLHREGGLQKALEEAEGKLIKKDPVTGTIDVAPVTMKLKRPEPQPVAVPEESIEDAIETATVTEVPTPVTERVIDTTPALEAPAPAWLQKGLASSEQTTEASAAPAAETQSEPVPVPEPAPSIPDFPPPPPPPAAPTEEQTQTEDDLLPPWLREEKGAKGTNGTTPIASVPPPVIETPAPPSPVAEPAPPPMPVDEPPAAPPVVTPVTTPEPAPEVVVLSEPPPASLSSVPSDDAAERERERKRRKRQRYRENVKKRKETEVGPGTGTGPGMIDQKKSDPVEALPQTPSIQTPPTIAAIPNPVPSPVPVPTPTAPIPQDIPPAETPAQSDDTVQFVIKAEGLPDEKSTKDENDQAA